MADFHNLHRIPDNKDDAKGLFRHTCSRVGVGGIKFLVNKSKMPTGATMKQSWQGNKLCKITSRKDECRGGKKSRIGRDKRLSLLVQWKGTINLWKKAISPVTVICYRFPGFMQSCDQLCSSTQFWTGRRLLLCLGRMGLPAGVPGQIPNKCEKPIRDL